MFDADIIIIGGGLGGLTCAELAERRGLSSLVLEKENNIGGLLDPIYCNGIECDRGPHYFFHSKKDNEVRDFIESKIETIDVNPYAITLPTGNVQEYIPYPLTRSLISPQNKKVKVSKNQIISFKDKMKEMVGATAYERFFHNYSKKVWGIDPSQLSSDFVSKKIRITENHEPFFGNLTVYRPVSGFGNLLNKIRPKNLINEKVKKLKITKSGVEIKGVNKIYTGKTAVITISPDQVFNIEPLKSRGLLLHYFCTQEKKELFPDPLIHWGYFPSKEYPFTRVTDMTRSCLQTNKDCKVFCFETPTDNPLPIKNIVSKKAISFLQKHNLKLVSPMPFQTIWIPQHAPIPWKHDMSIKKKLRNYVDQYPNLQLVGRFGKFEFLWMRDVIKDSIQSIDEIEYYLN